MKEQLLNMIFGWINRPPLLYNPFDWAMCVGQLALLKWCIDNLRKKKGKKENDNR